MKMEAWRKGLLCCWSLKCKARSLILVCPNILISDVRTTAPPCLFLSTWCCLQGLFSFVFVPDSNSVSLCLFASACPTHHQPKLTLHLFEISCSSFHLCIGPASDCLKISGSQHRYTSTSHHSSDTAGSPTLPLLSNLGCTEHF